MERLSLTTELLLLPSTHLFFFFFLGGVCLLGRKSSNFKSYHYCIHVGEVHKEEQGNATESWE